jgi:hypothetical protein
MTSLPLVGDDGEGRGSGTRDSPPDNGLQVLSGVVTRLYPLLLGEYALHLELATPAADGAVSRVIRRAVADLEAVTAEGTALL